MAQAAVYKKQLYWRHLLRGHRRVTHCARVSREDHWGPWDTLVSAGQLDVLNSCVRGGRDGLRATDIGCFALTADAAFPVRTARAPGRKIQKKLFSYANVACHAHIFGLLKLLSSEKKDLGRKSAGNGVMATELANTVSNVGENAPGLYQMSPLKRTDT